VRISSRIFVLISIFVSGSASAKINIVTTLPSFAFIAQEVGGDEVEAQSLTKGNQDPHFVDPKPDLILILAKAKMLVRVGLGLEDGWLPPLVNGSRNSNIQVGADGDFNVSEAMTLQEVPTQLDRAQGDVHPGGNPHYMLDPRNGVTYAKVLAGRLGKMVPEKESFFKQRAADFEKKISESAKKWLTGMSHLRGMLAVPYHRSWVYFFNWVGLQQFDTIEPKPGIPPSPEHVVNLTRNMQTKKVKAVLVELYYPTGVAQQIAEKTGAKLFVLPTEVYAMESIKTYFDIFDEISKKLSVLK
jgi:zinc/manganese transport system substrate-binding protein